MGPGSPIPSYVHLLNAKNRGEFDHPNLDFGVLLLLIALIVGLIGRWVWDQKKSKTTLAER
jgi:hypothetical protein